MAAFTIASLGAWFLVVLLAYLLRGRFFATFAAVILGVHTLSSSALASSELVAGTPWISGLAIYLQAVTYLHFATLVRPRMRSLRWRVLISVPASFFVAAVFLATPWAVAASLGFALPGLWIPVLAAFVGLLQSLFTREQIVELHLNDGIDAGLLAPHPQAVGFGAVEANADALTIVQITDPHLGPFMSEHRLRRICARAVARAPDLIVLTGDFLTMESQRDPEVLLRALAPLRALRGRVFACLGNHDYEALELVKRALRAAGIELLVDRQVLISTPRGSFQILGFDHVFRDREAHLHEVCERLVRRPNTRRIALLHDPGAFDALPPGTADIVFSGHTHGGQVGLVSLGLGWTVLRSLSSIPDHGLWAKGHDRLYIHRGTGHYGFPLRLGVPAEQSLIRLYFGEQR
ncbi:MAG TPA: phosphodiesterase [Nannocystis exedens]|nr:phosphodiesterase [Nannocystis exedens]